MNERPLRAAVLKLVGLVIAIAPATVAVLLYFPFWAKVGGGSVISGFALLLLVLCAVPFFKYVRRHFTAPSAHVMWLILFLLFFSLSRIAEQMTVISLVGFISNLISSFLFRAARRYEVRR